MDSTLPLLDVQHLHNSTDPTQQTRAINRSCTYRYDVFHPATRATAAVRPTIMGNFERLFLAIIFVVLRIQKCMGDK